jgi:hypothetical protein
MRNFCKSQTYLQGILPREALIAVVAGKRLDGEMDPLMPLQVMVAVEALWALIAFERPVVGSGLLVLRVTHEMRHSGCMTTVKSRHHGWMATNQGKSAIGVLNVGKDRGLAAGVLERWSLLVLVG